MKIVLVRGISGSGKSTFARKLHAALLAKGLRGSYLNTDEYFMSGGEYRFDVSMLSVYHAMTLNTFMMSLMGKKDFIIVDNVFDQLPFLDQYVNAAILGDVKKKDIVVVRMIRPMDLCFERNTHGVPQHTIERQHRNMADYHGEKMITRDLHVEEIEAFMERYIWKA